MASSVKPFLRLWCASLLCLSQAAPAAISQSIGSISFKAESLEADLQRNELVMQQVVITQNGYEIRADQARATGIDFRNSEWNFTGKVSIRTPAGASSADQAIVKFAQEAISELRISGQPATFQNVQSGRQAAQGQANRIEYDLTRQQIRFSDNAWFRYGQIEYQGKTVVYDQINNRILADRAEQQGERLQITVTPESGNTP